MNLTRRAYILAPGEMVRPPLLWWLEDHGFDRHRDITFIHEGRGVTLATCTAMRQALTDRVGMAFFCEHDAMPSAAATDAFVQENRYHLQCVKFETETAHSFDRFDSFHSLMWRCSGETLRAMAEQARLLEKPLCWEEHSAMGDTGVACHCQSLAKLAKLAGLSSGWMGTAGHVPRAGSKVPRICRYAP